MTVRPDLDEWSDECVAVLLWAGPGNAVEPADGRARLFIVAEGIDPPAAWSADEDWLCAPVDFGELNARRNRLRKRVAARVPVELDEFGLARRGSQWVALSESEAKVFAQLVRYPGELVTRTALLDGRSGADSRLLDGTMVRLRRRVESLGVVIHTVRSKGYILELAAAPQ